MSWEEFSHQINLDLYIIDVQVKLETSKTEVLQMSSALEVNLNEGVK